MKSLESRPLWFAAALIALVKLLQFTVDHSPLFFYDSLPFLEVAAGELFVAHRSYLYAGLVYLTALLPGTLIGLVLVQTVFSGFVAWLVAFVLIRHFRVRGWVAVTAALVFAIDPLQVAYERLIMTESAAMLFVALWLVTVLEYCSRPRLRWLVVGALLGIVMVGLRFVHLGPVLLSSCLLPAIPFFKFGTENAAAARRRWIPNAAVARSLALAMAVSLGSTALCHQGYRVLTGYLAGREPAYQYWTGRFRMATVASLIRPEDADRSDVAELIREQLGSPRMTLGKRGLRTAQLWDNGGLRDRLEDLIQDEAEVDKVAGKLATRATLRDPFGYLYLTGRLYASYWYNLRKVQIILSHEDGIGMRAGALTERRDFILSRYGTDSVENPQLLTPARRYHLIGAWWHLILVATPLLGLAVIRRLRGAAQLFAVVLTGWVVLTTAATMFGATETVYRYLHPFSFPCAILLGALAENVLEKARSRRTIGAAN